MAAHTLSAAYFEVQYLLFVKTAWQVKDAYDTERAVGGQISLQKNKDSAEQFPDKLKTGETGKRVLDAAKGREVEGDIRLLRAEKPFHREEAGSCP